MSSWSDWSARCRKVLDCLLHRQAPQAPPSRGARAEMIAECQMRAQGAQILARNARYRGGEIDLIAEHEGCIAFVEVRLRSHADYGGAAASITVAKQRRIVLAARHWLQDAGRAHRHKPCRFDAMLLDALDAGHVEWRKAAFDARPF
jgi:putative endonuclease